MEYSSSRISRPAYTVSEVETPLLWDKLEQERDEDQLTVEEIFIAPPLPRRPDYHRSYGARGPRPWGPPSTPSTIFHEGFRGGGYRGYEDDAYDCDRRPERYWRQRPPISPTASDDSSVCSVPECEECAYMDPRRGYSSRRRKRSEPIPVPYGMIPGYGIGPMPMSSPVPASPHTGAHPRAYIHEPPRIYRLQDSVELGHAGGPPPTREPSPTDNAPHTEGTHNQMILYRDGPDEDGHARSDGTSVLHSNVSSPRWSVAGQRYVSGSETRSDGRSHSPATSFDGRSLYEHPDPRFAHQMHAPIAHMQHRRAVVIVRSDASDEYERDRYSDGSGSEGSERSFGSSYYSEEYGRY